MISKAWCIYQYVSLTLAVSNMTEVLYESLTHQISLSMPPFYYYFFNWNIVDLCTSQVLLVVKNPPANAGDIRDVNSIPRSGRSPGEGNDNPLQCFCRGNPLDRGAWRDIVHGVAKSQTQQKWLSMHTRSPSWVITRSWVCCPPPFIQRSSGAGKPGSPVNNPWKVVCHGTENSG